MAAAVTTAHRTARGGGIIFRQFFEKESSTYTYLLACEETREAILIDPVDVTVTRDLGMIKDLKLKLVKVLNTHVHADHVTGSGMIKSKAAGVLSVLSKASEGQADVVVDPGDDVAFGTRCVKVRATPGHTPGCVSYVLDDETKVFTGDALLIRGCGRTDFQGGDASVLWDSVHEQLFTLPPTCAIYPAHDYQGRTQSTIAEESELNPRLTKTKEEFQVIMDNLGLNRPAKMDVAVPANMRCGVPEV